MKDAKRFKITEDALVPSKLLTESERLIYPYTNKDGNIVECPIFGLVSDDGCVTEEEALASLEKKKALLVEAIPGDEYYSIDGEIRIWSGREHEDQEVPFFVAYERVVLPELSFEQAREIIKNSKMEDAKK
jgi:hypothetical protein